MKFDIDISQYNPEFVQMVINTIRQTEPEKINGSIIKQVLDGFLKGRDGTLTKKQFGSLLYLMESSFKGDDAKLIRNCVNISNKYVQVRTAFKALSSVDDAHNRTILFTAFLNNLFEKHLTDVSETFEELFTEEAIKKIGAANNYRWSFTKINMSVTNHLVKDFDDAEFCSIIAGLFNIAAVTDLQDVLHTVKSIGELDEFGGEKIEDRLKRLADEYDVFSVMDRPRATQCVNNIVKQMKADYKKKDSRFTVYKHPEEVTHAILYFLTGGDEDRIEAIKFEIKIGG